MDPTHADQGDDVISSIFGKTVDGSNARQLPLCYLLHSTGRQLLNDYRAREESRTGGGWVGGWGCK